MPIGRRRPRRRGRAGPGADRRRRLSRLARSRPHRRRQGAARGGAAGARRGRDRGRRAADRHRQGARPRRRARDLLHAGRAALQAAAARPGALFRAAPARRGAPLRDRRAPAKRKREMAKSPLDEIPGIGPTRKRALLHHFGTVKAIERAALEDLMKAPGRQRRDRPRGLRFLPRAGLRRRLRKGQARHNAVFAAGGGARLG